MKWTIAAIALVSACSAGKQRTERSGPAPWEPPARVSPPAYLPPVAREILRQRMAQHGRDITELIAAMVAVDYPLVADAADRIRSDAFARPLTEDATELNALLPAKFFDMQEALQRRAGTLSHAAKRHDADATSQAYAALSETCVSCHAIYREGQAGPTARH